MQLFASIAIACSTIVVLAQALQTNQPQAAEPRTNTSDNVDLVTFTSRQSGSSAVTQTLGEKCNKNSSNRRCQKYREKEKQSKLASVNDIWNDVDMLQHPIDEEPRRMDRALGEMCLYSSDCVSGCCMLDRETKIRSCQPKAIQGEKCTTAQIKADLYVDVCPCESGDSNCVYPGEYCMK